MPKNLVIVESPAKAKTIEGFLGKDFVVKSCFGHVRDLPQKEFGIEIENDFAPKYEISTDKKKVIADLKKSAKGCDTVWLASDEDREGEAISWHLVNALELKEENIKRIVFHEITKTAILKAIEKPREINKNLVDAQQARRVLDRLVGFELSPVLWKKVRPALSAGRVQSVAVRLIVEREKEINAFNTSASYKVTAIFNLNKDGGVYEISAEIPQKFNTKEEVAAFLNKCTNASFNVDKMEKKPAKKTPSAPFTTSTLQQEASRKLGFSVARTMTIAQQLYESGKITYMRTDSVNLSEFALSAAQEEITKSYGDNYVKIRKYSTKSKGAQEAHEAIRPTYLNQSTVDGNNAQVRLYELIWKRTIASQMSDAELEKTTININVSGASEQFVAKGEVLKFDGFLKVYMESSEDDEEETHKGLLPSVKKGDELFRNIIKATERFSKHAPRYTEASLVKKMEELGIGRPSTYAPTISTIQRRGYVINESREGVTRDYHVLTLAENEVVEEVRQEKTGSEKSKLFPTDIGIIVNDFLIEHFSDILEYNFTANVEKEFDMIAEGQKAWNTMIKEFYKPFHLKVEDTLENSQKASGERLLGDDPATGLKIYAKIGRFGAIVQLGEAFGETKPKFAGLKKEQNIDTVTLEEALELFKLPRTVGEYEEEEVVAAVGRFGPYLKHKSAFFSLPKEDDPLEVNIERAIEVIEAKKQKDLDNIITLFPEDEKLKVLKGRWGAYISYNKKNFKIPKGENAAELSLKQCKEIIKLQKSGAKSPAKKTTKKKK